MKKILLVLAILYFGFFAILKITHAQTISPLPQVIVPGTTCGDPFSSNPDIRKCCKMPVFTPDLYAEAIAKDVPLVGAALSDFIGDKLRDKLAPILFTQSQVSNQPCLSGVPSTPGNINDDKCVCILEPTKTPLSALEPMCKKIDPRWGEQGRCDKCVQGGGAWTAIGCFDGNLSTFISQQILGTGVGIAGGISLLCLMFAAFQMQTSRGNAEKVKKAQEMMTNCITGLMVILFSILILRIIGVNILRIPGFI